MSRPLEGVRAFLSGPMSEDPHNHVNEFIDAHRRLNELGATYVYDPAAEWVGDVNRGVADRGHEHYMRRCVNELTRSLFGEERQSAYYDLLVQLDGWSESAGARVEEEVARACGIEVVRFERLGEWIERSGR